MDNRQKSLMDHRSLIKKDTDEYAKIVNVWEIERGQNGKSQREVLGSWKTF